MKQINSKNLYEKIRREIKFSEKKSIKPQKIN